MKVALRKESVDRNDTVQVIVIIVDTVALRKESVDRNCPFGLFGVDSVSSLSARRAWIEIANNAIISVTSSRSPQGERG